MAISVRRGGGGGGAAPVLDPDLDAIAALAPPDDALIQRKAGAWTTRTPAQVKADMSIAGPTYLDAFKWGVD